MAPAMAFVAAPLVSCRCSAPCIDPAPSPSANADANAAAVRSAMRSCSTSSSMLSRRGLVSAGATAMAMALGMGLQQQEEVAMARDIPLFGIRKRAEKLEKEVVKEVKELVKEGEKEVKELVKEGEKEATVVAEAVFPSKRDNRREEPQAFSPALQAGAVVAAELVGVAVAATVVNGLVGQPSK